MGIRILWLFLVGEVHGSHLDKCNLNPRACHTCMFCKQHDWVWCEMTAEGRKKKWQTKKIQQDGRTYWVSEDKCMHNRTECVDLQRRPTHQCHQEHYMITLIIAIIIVALLSFGLVMAFNKNCRQKLRRYSDFSGCSDPEETYSPVDAPLT